MNSRLENALKDLEASTDALLEVDLQDVVAVCRALERRADAITRVAFLMEEVGQLRPAVGDRLSAALARGDRAARHALRMKLDAIEEWTRLNQIARGLNCGRPHAEPVVDCSA
jgi:hypothetical protein